MLKICFITLGCRVNQYESRAFSEKLAENGFSEVSFSENADVFVINTCSVTGESARKSRQMIRRALRIKEKHPEKIVCATGCYIEGELDAKIRDELFDKADIVLSNGEKEKLCEKLLAYIKNRERFVSSIRVKDTERYQELFLSGSKNARAFIKIEDGCNSFCSYCFIPFVRGRVRSRNEEDILQEIRRVSENGFREIVLTGIETGSYGEDLDGEESLISLVEKAAKIEKVDRIRFGSLKPTIFTNEFCDRLSKVKKVMPHFHLSLQSGNSRILREMNRHYDRNDEINAIKRIYSSFADAALSADIICGFPSETDEEFADSVGIIEEFNFLHTHIFPFSPREKTVAAKRNDFIDEETKKNRTELLLLKAKESSEKYASEFFGKRMKVLCEKVKNGKMFGYTENFIYTETAVPDGVRVGDIYDVVLTDKCSFSVETLTVICDFIG